MLSWISYTPTFGNLRAWIQGDLDSCAPTFGNLRAWIQGDLGSPPICIRQPSNLNPRWSGFASQLHSAAFKLGPRLSWISCAPTFGNLRAQIQVHMDYLRSYIRQPLSLDPRWYGFASQLHSATFKLGPKLSWISCASTFGSLRLIPIPHYLQPTSAIPPPPPQLRVRKRERKIFTPWLMVGGHPLSVPKQRGCPLPNSQPLFFAYSLKDLNGHTTQPCTPC